MWLQVLPGFAWLLISPPELYVAIRCISSVKKQNYIRRHWIDIELKFGFQPLALFSLGERGITSVSEVDMSCTMGGLDTWHLKYSAAMLHWPFPASFLITSLWSFGHLMDKSLLLKRSPLAPQGLDNQPPPPIASWELAGVEAITQ